MSNKHSVEEVAASAYQIIGYLYCLLLESDKEAMMCLPENRETINNILDTFSSIANSEEVDNPQFSICLRGLCQKW